MEIWKHCPKRVYASPRQALEVVLAHRLHFSRGCGCSETSSPCGKHVETWQRSELTDVTAKVVIYEAFVEGKLEAHQTRHPDPASPVLRAVTYCNA